VGSIDWYFRLNGKLVHKYCSFFLMTSADGETVPQVEEGISECRWLPAEEAASHISYDNARGIVEEAVRMLEESPELAGPS
jgi:hypothetical protein